MPMMCLRSVQKNFGSAQILRDIDLDVDEGEFVALVGPSGCGKSTLLRVIAGLEELSGGEVHIDGRKVNDLPPMKRDIAMVFQSYALYPHMRVRDNMGFSLKLRRLKPADISAAVERAAEILGLTELLDRFPGDLSGGQRQRVAMGRAIVRSPKLFLFDEPLSNLDAKLRTRMRTEIKELHQRLRSTTVYVTHDQIEAMTMASRIVVMRGGMIEQMGSPLELYDQPDNIFVAGFLGSPSMNFLNATVEGGGRNVAVIDRHNRLAAAGTEKLAAGADVIVGIRPENLTVVEDLGQDDCLVGRVVVVEPTGSETQLLVKLEEQELTVLLRKRMEFSPGETIRLMPASGAVYIFDPASERRIVSDTARAV